MSLSSLPVELISQVVEQLRVGTDNDTLKALARTSQALKAIAERHLYSSAVFTTCSQLHTLHEAVRAHPERGAYMRNLELPWSTRSFDYGSPFDPLDLCRLPNLTSFLSESPFCNALWSGESAVLEGWNDVVRGYLDSFMQASLLTHPGPGGERPLKHLRHLTLHWTGDQDTRFWETTPFCPIFLLPTLRSLEISCVTIISPPGPAGGWDSQLAGLSRQTNLKSLTLTRCSIAAESLVPILSFPKALETFSILEVLTGYAGSFNSSCITDNMDVFNAALAQQSESLRRLQIRRSASPRRGSPSPFLSLELSNFRCLSQLNLGPHCDGPRGRWKLVEPVPPALTTLCLLELWGKNVGGDGASEFFSSFPVGQLVANADARGVSFELDIGLARGFPDRTQQSVDDFVSLLTSQGILPAPASKRRVRFLTAQRVPFIPPYLYDEKKPYYKVRYDTSTSSGYVDAPDNSEPVDLDIGTGY
ncbi:hypothetical protein F5X99DRAFT_414212 [Biscogniauxia marginata]|nr:hypothetical protein F5X99DRAFT_414212 [Biscogniauxia marginata]